MLSKKSKTFLSPLWNSGISINLIDLLQTSKYKHEFIELSRLGKGGYGSVFKVICPTDQKEYAIKKISIKNVPANLLNDDSSNYKKLFSLFIRNNKFKVGFREVTSMSRLCNHTNLVRFYRSWCEIAIETPSTNSPKLIGNSETEESKELTITSSESEYFDDESMSTSQDYSGGSHEISPLGSSYIFTLYIQMQACEKDTLKEWLNNSQRVINDKVNMKIFKQILRGVEHIHRNGFIHRDLKPTNVFLQHSNKRVPKIKIGDFGLAKQLNNDLFEACDDLQKDKAIDSCQNGGQIQKTHTTEVGTHFYMAPEVVTGIYNEKADIYSLGVILYELYHNFTTEMERFVTLTNFKNGIKDLEFKNKFPKVYKMLKRMTSPDPELRPSASMLLAETGSLYL